MGKFFDDLNKGVREIRTYKKRKLALRSELIKIPDLPKTQSSKDIKRNRKSGLYNFAKHEKD